MADIRYDNNDIRNIIFEKINDKYSYGKYGTFDVIIMNRNGYINATRLCESALNRKGKPKQFRDWKVNKNTNELLNALSAAAEYPAAALMIEITTGSSKTVELRGHIRASKVNTPYSIMGVSRFCHQSI